MANVREEKPAKFIDFVRLVEDLQEKSTNSLWYRGCGKADYLLLPTLYRLKPNKTAQEWGKFEAKVMGRFRQRSIPFHDRSLVDDWDAIFFMQHYGTPTRLLDWTENPFIGLYFAVMSAPFQVTKKGKLKFKTDAAVWILDPHAWNKHSLAHITYDGGVLAPGDEALKGYKPSPSFENMFNHPVALYGAHNSPRIVAQRGVFTLFGQETQPMETVYDQQNFPQDSLIKVTLEHAVIDKFRSSVLNNGITESVVQPDLDGLGREIRRTFGFEY